MTIERITCLVAALLLLPSACGGTKDSVSAAHGPNDLTQDQIDADPIALLPGAAVVLATADARAFYQSGSLGAQIGQITEQLVPIGDEAGFKPSRDVDRVTLAAYSMQGADVAAVVSGTFDEAKINLAAQNHTPTKSGGAIVASTYGGRTLFTLSNIGFTILSPKTAVAGTEAGIRRTLDRIKDGRVKRDLPAWMISTIETKEAAVAVAVDFSSPSVSAAAANLPIGWLDGLRAARVLGNFHEPGMNIAGSLTYADAQHASAGADGVRRTGAIANVLAITGQVPQLRNLTVDAVDTNVEYKFAVDDRSLRSLLSQVPQWIAAQPAKPR